MEIAGDVLLDPEIIRLAFILGQETGDGLGIADDRAGDEVPLLAERDRCYQKESETRAAH
jgi:hypothetical protein